jgi:FHA domain-containing protein
VNEQGELAGILRIVLQGLAGAGVVVAAGGLGVYLALRARRKRFAAASAPHAGIMPTRSSPPVGAAAPPTEGMIVCTAGPERGQDFALGQGVTIGRDATRADIVIDDPQVSGQHVWIGPLDGRIVVRDYGSTNGTFLNGDLVNRVTEQALRDGDVLTLGGQGSVKFTFRKL